MPEEIADPSILFDTGAVWGIVEQLVFFLFSVIIGVTVLVILYKAAEYWFTRDRFELIDIHGINYKQLFGSTKKNAVPSIIDHDFISLGSTHIWGLIKGSVKLVVSVDENPKLKDYFDKKNFTYDYEKMTREDYKPQIKTFETVIFRLDKNRNRVLKAVSKVLTFLKNEFIVDIPFEKIYIYKHIGGGNFYLKPLEKYSELKGNVYIDVDSLIEEYDGIYRPSSWGSKELDMLESQLYKHRYMIALKDSVNQVRLAGYTDHKYTKSLDMNTVKREVLSNQASSAIATEQGGVTNK